jgi:hypothetical protein
MTNTAHYCNNIGPAHWPPVWSNTSSDSQLTGRSFKDIPYIRGYCQEPFKRCFADGYKMARAAREYNLNAKFSTTLARVADMAHK